MSGPRHCIDCSRVKALGKDGLCIQRTACRRAMIELPRIKERGEVIGRMHDAGVSYAIIAKTIGVSRQRVYWLHQRYKERWG